ncbi:flagellar basal body-associated FliL family protein [Fodinisporobacter ferrooxydans]|uniref:Flagellar protein FliL n=1 Tax=Fodinisporobacter ferrooxydans TaxID=2901836 RepID=A0ABY4CFQ2_9BACL|nr:flagellar basal body-associated FliL family protein [Alicyclobacillaceae bacterium MYW30-H2]
MKNKLVKTMILILLIITVLAVGIVFGYVYFFKSPGVNKPHVPTAAEMSAAQYALPQITTNLQGGSIIQVTITLQADSSKAKDELDKRKAQVMDTINGLLHDMTKVDLEKPDGLNLLKKKIIQSINSYMSDGKVTDVYYANPIIQ